MGYLEAGYEHELQLFIYALDSDRCLLMTLYWFQGIEGANLVLVLQDRRQ